jgi:hypothetical protein
LACERDRALCTSGKLRRLCRNRAVYINVSRPPLSPVASQEQTILSSTSHPSSPLFFAFNNMHSTILYQPPSKPLSSVNTPNRIPTCYQAALAPSAVQDDTQVDLPGYTPIVLDLTGPVDTGENRSSSSNSDSNNISDGAIRDQSPGYSQCIFILTPILLMCRF